MQLFIVLHTGVIVVAVCRHSSSLPFIFWWGVYPVIIFCISTTNRRDQEKNMKGVNEEYSIAKKYNKWTSHYVCMYAKGKQGILLTFSFLNLFVCN